MKKFFNIFASVLMTAMLSFALVACDKDDKSDPEPETGSYSIELTEETDTKLVYVQSIEYYTLTYTFEFGPDGLCSSAIIVVDCFTTYGAELAEQTYTALVDSENIKREGNKVIIDAISLYGIFDKFGIKTAMKEVV